MVGVASDALDLELRLANACEPGRRQRAHIEQARHPAMAAVRTRLVLEAPDRGEHAPVAEVPLLDLVVVALDVGPELLEVRPEPLLHRVEPRLAPISVRIDPAELQQVVLDLLEGESVDVALGLVPVGRLSRLE